MKTSGILQSGLPRYLLASVGPFGSAAAQFLLSVVLLRQLSSHDFGSFSFLLVVSQFSWGIWSALFCAPLPVLMTSGTVESRESIVRSVTTANLIAVFPALLIAFILAAILGQSLTATACFSAYFGVALLRWFARAHSYATKAPVRTACSDAVYCVVLIVGIICIAAAGTATVEYAFLLLLVAAASGMLPFGKEFLKNQFVKLDFRTISVYRKVWSAHAKWSLLGVVTTELTANSHVYLVTLIFGAAAFAPIAASALLTRPINVAMNALSEFERAQLAHHLGLGRLDLAKRAVALFRRVLAATWIATIAATILIIHLKPSLIFPSQYAVSTLWIGAFLWLVVAGLRASRTPDSVLLQAAGAFKPLALASVGSSGVSLFAVACLLLVTGPVWSIAGIAVGEFFFAMWIWRESKRWRIAAENARQTLYN